MSAQPSLAQLDLSDLKNAIPENIRSVILISNVNLHLSITTLKLLKEAAPCLFVHHNIAKNLKELRAHYPTESYEMLFIRGNGIGYWGLTNNTGQPIYKKTKTIPHCGIFALRGQLDLADRPEIRKIDTNWLTTLEQQELYPEGKRPSTGFYTRKLFEAIAKQHGKLQVCTLGFSPDPAYWNSSMTSFHDFQFEAEELQRSQHLRRHQPLDGDTP